MYQHLVVSTSDAVNRYFGRFTPGALISALWDTCLTGIPMTVGHDTLRPLGWSHPFAVHFEPHLTRLVGVWLIPETDQETAALGHALHQHFAHELYEQHGDDLERLKQLLSPYLQGTEAEAVTECVALVEQGLATRACPTLFAAAEQDRDGLVALDSLVPLGPGVFRVGELALFAHPYFRRSMFRLNTLNEPFFDRLERVRTEGRSRIVAKLALDPDMVGLASTYRRHFEHEYWWGPRFDDDLTRIRTGVTRHEADEMERLFHGISRTEFWWQSRDGLHIFEAEELRNIPSAPPAPWEEPTEDLFGCRYVHSIVQEGTGEIVHFDGAVRAYPEGQMLERLDANIAAFGRHSIYSKVWRINGTVATSDWKSLLSDYFRDNHLVGEYLGAPPDEIGPTAPDSEAPPESHADSVYDRYLPYSIDAGEGVRVVLSCREPRGEYAPGRSVIPVDALTSDGARVPIVECDTIELRKVLARYGETVTIPEDTGYINWKDFYTNLPLIFHNGEGDDLARSVRGTLEAVRTLVDAWIGHGYDLVAVCNLGFLLQGREVRLSVLGHVRDLKAWLDSPLSMPPLSEADLREWAHGVSAYLRNYPPANDQPPLEDTLKLSGLLLIERQLLDQTIYEFRYDPDRVALTYVLAIPASEVALCDAVRNSDVIPAHGFRLLESICSRCGQPYLDCGCSKLLDEDVVQEIIEARDAFLFWTNRPV